jgi:hypothetical protein
VVEVVPLEVQVDSGLAADEMRLDRRQGIDQTDGPVVDESPSASRVASGVTAQGTDTMT